MWLLSSVAQSKCV